LTVEEAAEVLGISRGLGYELVRSGELPSLRLGHRVVIPRRVVDELLASVTVESPAAPRVDSATE
jgi:excisionase family DNA binding protein